MLELKVKLIWIPDRKNEGLHRLILNWLTLRLRSSVWMYVHVCLRLCMHNYVKCQWIQPWVWREGVPLYSQVWLCCAVRLTAAERILHRRQEKGLVGIVHYRHTPPTSIHALFLNHSLFITPRCLPQPKLKSFARRTERKHVLVSVYGSNPGVQA